MKTFFATLFLYFVLVTANAQKLGINTTSPQSTLDVNGDLALRAGQITLKERTNNDINTSTNRFSFYNLTGEGATFITGFTGGNDGRIITLFNKTDATLSFINNYEGSAAANRLLLTTGTALLLNKNENITLIYNASIARWIVANTAGGDSWKLKGNAGTDSATDFLGTVDDKPIMLRLYNSYAGRMGSDGLIAIGRGTSQNYSHESIVAIGDSVLYNNGTVASNYGYQNNTGVGSKVLVNNTYGGQNTAMGFKALYANTMGGDNNAIGAFALVSNTTGGHNDALGRGALGYNTTGSVNIAIGRLTMSKNLTGSRNTAIGTQSLYYNTSGNENTAVGYQAGSDYSNLNNTTAIGAGARVDNANCMVFGNGYVNGWAFGRTAPGSGAALQVGTNATNGNGAWLSVGGAWTNGSDSTKKEAITKLDGASILAKIKQLPITRWKYKGTNEYHIGPMAQDFYTIFNVGLNNTSISSIDPAGIALRAVQAQQEIIEQQNSRITALENKINELLKR